MISLNKGQLLTIKQSSGRVVKVGGIPPDFAFDVPVDMIMSIMYICDGCFDEVATIECLIALKNGSIKRGWLWEDEINVDNR